ncbi:hypothetical protein S40285_03669 [Stachybotrys chlorohalonatus IBT 40285]|uniref:glutathione transferase n=1 Tax=Stachybotrys chlorohalonatus (strain IBT 40285) TaxID=1283841 RepID=A0A084QTK7_STAC4|nr:hypothetical protein S40285_03669 [Stachybotrys chlorohalonata IBT 40285]
MLIVHHLQRGQSERIVWLCEELGVPYQLKTYERDAKTFQAPPQLQAIHPSGSAPVIEDGDVVLAESSAIVEYILTKYGNGKLSVAPTEKNYADYLYFLHFANGNLQPAILRMLLVERTGIAVTDPSAYFTRLSFEKSFKSLEERLSDNTWLAGEEFTAADIMVVFSLTTMRIFYPYSLAAYPSILAFLRRVGEREGYQRAMRKGDPGLKLLLDAQVPKK